MPPSGEGLSFDDCPDNFGAGAKNMKMIKNKFDFEYSNQLDGRVSAGLLVQR